MPQSYEGGPTSFPTFGDTDGKRLEREREPCALSRRRGQKPSTHATRSSDLTGSPGRMHHAGWRSLIKDT